MSIKYLNRAFESTVFNSMEKLLMIALCDCVNDNGNGFPGYKALMKKTSMAKSTLSKHLNILKSAGVITTKSHGEIGKGRKVNTYHVAEFWKDENLKTSIFEARKEAKVRGLNLSQKQPEKYEGRTDTKSTTLEPRKVRGSNPKSTRVEHEPSVLTISNEPSVKRNGYAFLGETIKLNQKDFDQMVELYPNLDLTQELKQLDLELKNEKKWFMPLNAKLNYRNKKAGNTKETNRISEKDFGETVLPEWAQETEVSHAESR